MAERGRRLRCGAGDDAGDETTSGELAVSIVVAVAFEFKDEIDEVELEMPVVGCGGQSSGHASPVVSLQKVHCRCDTVGAAGGSVVVAVVVVVVVAAGDMMKVDIDEEFEENEVSPSSDDAGVVGAAATAVGGGVLSALAPTDVEGPDPHVAAGELAADEVVDVEVVAVVAAGNGSMVANKGKLTESRMRSASYVAVSYDRREYVSRRVVQRHASGTERFVPRRSSSRKDGSYMRTASSAGLMSGECCCCLPDEVSGGTKLLDDVGGGRGVGSSVDEVCDGVACTTSLQGDDAGVLVLVLVLVLAVVVATSHRATSDDGRSSIHTNASHATLGSVGEAVYRYLRGTSRPSLRIQQSISRAMLMLMKEGNKRNVPCERIFSFYSSSTLSVSELPLIAPTAPP